MKQEYIVECAESECHKYFVDAEPGCEKYFDEAETLSSDGTVWCYCDRCWYNDDKNPLCKEHAMKKGWVIIDEGYLCDTCQTQEG